MKRTLPNKTARGGFTLIELLVVIAILGILMSLVLTQGPAAMRKVRQTTASNSLKGILTAYKSYMGSADRVISSEGKPEEGGASSVSDFAEVLARAKVLNDGAAWYIESDERLDGQTQKIPQTVYDNGTNNLKTVQPISWAVVVDAKSKAKNGDTNYPLMWTRGLETGGSWKKDAPWGDEGGHIGFADGHVKWYVNTKIKGNKLLKAKEDSGSRETESYQEAIGDSARALEDK